MKQLLTRVIVVLIVGALVLIGCSRVRGEELPRVQWGSPATLAEAWVALDEFNAKGLSPALKIFYGNRSIDIENAKRGYYALTLEDGWQAGASTFQHIIEEIPGKAPGDKAVVRNRVIVRSVQLTDMTASRQAVRANKSPEALITDACQYYWGKAKPVTGEITTSLLVTGASSYSVMREDRRYGFTVTIKGGYVWGLAVTTP